MPTSRHELIEFLAGEIEELKRVVKGHVQCRKHLDELDSICQSVEEDSLDHWADEDLVSIYARLEREADRILATA